MDTGAAWPLEFCPGGRCLSTHTSHIPHMLPGPSSRYPGAESQREWVCMSSKSVTGPLRGCSFFCCPNPYRFLQPEVMGTYVPDAETLGWVFWTGTGIPRSHGIPSIFLSTTRECGIACSHLCVPLCATHCLHASPPCTSAPLRISVTPTHVDGCCFFKSSVVGHPHSLIF